MRSNTKLTPKTKEEIIMILNTLRAAVLVISLSAYSANSALITNLSNLDIDGTLYDVTFITSDSFNTIFDVDNDLNFGEGDGSLIDRAPIFFGNLSGAHAAGAAIITALGTNDVTNALGRDSFLIPVDKPTKFHINGVTDLHSAPGNDFLNTRFIGARSTGSSIATFKLASQNNIPTPSTLIVQNNIPTPSTLALAGLALALMGVLGRRRHIK